jgi:hypothetical protein
VTGPIKPDDVEKKKIANLPEEVFTVINNLIVKHWNSGASLIFQNEIIVALVKLGFTEQQIFSDHLLDVEAAYRAAGWKVDYDKPGFCETYEASFIFKK